MSDNVRWCVECRWLERRIEASGPGSYLWCSKLRENLGSSVFGRPACDEAVPRPRRRRRKG